MKFQIGWKRPSPSHKLINLAIITATASLIKAFQTDNSAQYSSTMAHIIKVIPNSKLYTSEPPPEWFGNPNNLKSDDAWTNGNWLKSRFHFSFAEYRNGINDNFGVVRVMNDDLVQPKRGFGTHPHGDMEIITYIVNGELTHQDSMGTKESLGRGSIQFMTAGTGVRHSEFNHEDKPLRFIQTWIVPRSRGLAPNYGSYNASKDCAAKKNQVQYLASDVMKDSAGTPVKVNQDVDVHSAELELGQSLQVDVAEGRQAYLLCVEGTLEVNGKRLERHDGCEIQGDGSALEIKATGVEETENGQVAHFLMFTMEAVPGSGRSDIQ
jgi:redox-sensitive bicupin YhaK (pirin superfamily)